MDNRFSKIKANLLEAFVAETVAESVIIGQIEELAECFRDKNLSYADAYMHFKRVFDFKALSKEFFLFCSALAKNGSLINDIQTSPSDAAKVSFLDISSSRKALGVFNNTVVLQSEAEHDFTSVCEAAYSGRSKFAILPLYNTSNGLMVSLYRSLQKYDLKICLGTSVIMNDDVSESYFFLLSHEKHFFRYADHILLDVTRTADGSIHKLLYILSEFGVKVKSFNSLPLEYTDERCENIIFLDCSKTDMNALMCYISSALSDANIIGIFPFVN